MNKKICISAIAATLLLLAACAQQPAAQPIIIQQAPPQQQQQQQTVIIQEAPAQPVVPVPVQVAPSSWCGGLRQTYLSAGMTVSVSRNPDLGNVLRRSPYKQSEYMGLLEPGGRVYLLDGPYCDNGQYIYWHVQVIDKDYISNRGGYGNSVYNSVYTAETDTTGARWLVP